MIRMDYSRGRVNVSKTICPIQESMLDSIFFDELYKGFIIERINADRFISRNADKRKASASEILVRNY